jgi:hypothetical protein
LSVVGKDSCRYSPIPTVRVPGAEGTALAVETEGLVVLVGPNSSGKTLFLKDVENVILATGEQPVVCQEMFLQRPADCNSFVQDLLTKQFLQPAEPGHVQIASPHFGRGGRDNIKFQLQAIQTDFYDKFPNGWTAATKLAFFVAFGKLLVTSLFIDNRITMCSPVNRFDLYTAAPQNDLQALFLDTDAQDKLEAETGKVFGNAAWLDTVTRNALYVLRASGHASPPPEKDRRDPKRADSYRLLDHEGHGFKSYVGIVIALLLGRRPVRLIDEPELCLHPPQAYALGRFIGEYGSSGAHVTFVATHSSHALRGIIETAPKLTVLRLTNIEGRFKGHLLSDEDLKAAIKRRTTRAETVLDGIFSQAVAIVEAEGDRAVYQAAGEGIEHDFKREVHFVATHGTGGIDEICKFYRSLRIPVAIVADLDVVTDRPKMTSFLTQLASDDETRALLQLCEKVEKAVREIPPTITEDQVKQELGQIAGTANSWANRDDIELRSRLSKLCNTIDRLHELKTKGKAGVDAMPQIKQDLEEVMRRCGAVGLFLAPCGQLENWVPHLMSGVSKRNKSKWADEAARRIQEAAIKMGDIWEFVHSVTAYLHERAKAGD